jgi:hypothetical protein
MTTYTEATERVANWKAWHLWVSDDGYSLFSTDAAFEWFVRKHRGELIGSGQFIPGRGSSPGIVGPQFDQVVLDILRRKARAGIEETLS